MIADGGQALRVPPIVAKVLESLAVDTASGFVAYARTYPSTIAEGLNWDLGQVEHACDDLVATLRGHVDASLLDIGVPEDFGFGALLPGQ